MDMDSMQCDPNVANLPLSDPRCVKAVECCTAFYAGENGPGRRLPGLASFGSPPIAIRTGLRAFACVPILVALAGKANIITLLTGISYEKLNVVHQWVSWMSFALSLIHAIPFFVASVQDKGDGGYARVVSEFYRYGNGAMTEYSGVPPLAMLFGLCVFSFPQIRRRFYESFYFVHIGLAITYLDLLFWHAGDAEDSWVRIEVEGPADFHTKPGQHAFLRFLSLSPLDNHPFTIASAPTVPEGTGPSTMENGKGPDTILFLSKVHEGFTRTLAAHCLANGGEATTTVILDGPYGGLARQHIERRYDSLLLIAGGSGISSSLSWLHHAVCALSTSMLQTVTLVWAVRDAESFGWAYRDIELATRLESSGVDIRLCFFVTGAAVEVTPLSASAKSKEYSGTVGLDEPRPWTERIQALGQLTSGRPDLRTVVEDAIMPGKRLIVLACGPHGMNHNFTSICSAAQKRVLSGQTKEVALHVKTFGW
ncbi:ferric reductase [Colletotrichum sojae]|uniref:ferric-chelate reductase (NADPH) n=1 Tax=Colletotrichum sojae TaxID=2175907 RepID=A0A8H6IR31_9PEZI|nr:ferric reductase [Colletotrichum sojae]